MLEIFSHKYLKQYLKQHSNNWKNIYSFGRIISQWVQTDKNYLINSEIFLTNEWYSALLISLFLSEENVIFILPREEIEFLKSNNLTYLKDFGFNFLIKDDQIIFSKFKISLLTLKDFVINSHNVNLNNQRIVLTKIENLKEDLKNILRISLFKKSWFQEISKSKNDLKEIRSKYDHLKKMFFLKALPNKEKVYLDKIEISLLKEFFLQNDSFSSQFKLVKDALFSNWACWVKLDYDKFEWILNLEPIDEISEIKDIFLHNNFLFLSSFRRDNFFKKLFKSHNLTIDLEVNFKSNFIEKDILIYIPPRQMLPNNPLFAESVFKDCNKLFLLKKKLTVILINSNANDLKINLATYLASQHGERVVIEKLPKAKNLVLIAGFDWWIKNLVYSAIPEQIIIPVLPIPDITDPINEETISFNFKQNKDWFRDFLFIETIKKMEKSISPLRKNSGLLVMLDGRIATKQWGIDLLKYIQPSKVLNYIFPFE